MSNLILQSDNSDVDVTYRGLTFTLRSIPDMQGYSMRQVEKTAAVNGSPDSYESLSLEDRGRVLAYAMIGTMIVNMKPALINGVEINYTNPSSLPEFETQVEELIAMNAELRDELFTRAISLKSKAPDYLNVADIAGNSSAPSDFTEVTAQLSSVQG